MKITIRGREPHIDTKPGALIITLDEGSITVTDVGVPVHTDTAPPAPHNEFMSVREFAAYIGIGTNFAYRLVRQPGFPAVFIGEKTVRVNVEEAVDWLKTFLPERIKKFTRHGQYPLGNAKSNQEVSPDASSNRHRDSADEHPALITD